MTKIIGFAHAKQSGKSTACKFLKNWVLQQKVLGKIPVSCDQGHYGFEQEVEFSKYRNAKIYSFADELKETCINLFGIDRALIYGGEKEKNTLTKFKWENMPGVIEKSLAEYVHEHYETSNGFTIDLREYGLVIHDPGPMSVREFMQYFGTGICRKIYENIWVDATMRKIQHDGCDFAFIEDTRFGDSEGTAIHAAGGKIIKFLRRPFPDDNHESEVDMLNYEADATIDNRNMTVEEKNEEVLRVVQSWGWL